MTAFRNRAIYRNYDPMAHEGIDRSIIEECVPLWRECAKRANSRYGGAVKGNNKGRASALRCPDDILREHGVTFARDRRLWAAYEKQIRLAANVKPRQGRKACADRGPRVL